MIGTVRSIFDIVYPVCAIASFLALGYKLHDLRRDPRSTALQALCAARLCTALAYVWITPWIYTALDQAAGIANLCTLLSNGFIVLSSLASQVMMLSWFNSPAEARRKASWIWALYCSALAAMIVLFLHRPLPGEHPVDFEVHFARLPVASAYIMTYLGIYSVNLANIARLTWPPSRAIKSPWLRRSLRLTAVGSVFVMGYLVGKLTGVVGRWAGTDLLDSTAVLWGPMLANTGSLVMVAGSTFPGWGRRVLTLGRQYRSFRRLYPLWFALYRATPGIALFAPRSSRPPLVVRGLETRLYRLTIEIMDGQRALRPYLDSDASAQSLRAVQNVSLSEAQLQALKEAYDIRLRIWCKERGVGVGAEATVTVEQRRFPDPAGELAWLERVSRAFVKSSTVAVMAELIGDDALGTVLQEFHEASRAP